MILCFCRLSFGRLPVDERDLFERAIHQTGHCHCKKHYKKSSFSQGKAADGIPQKLTFRDGLMPGLEGIAVDFCHGFAGGGYRCDIEQTAQRRCFASEADEFFHVGFGVAQV